MFTLIPRRISVQPGWVLLEYRDGSLSRLLQPGRHRKRSSGTYIPVSIREQLVTIGMQEILTSDAVSVRVSAAVRLIVTDPVRFAEVSTVPIESVYLAVQVALRVQCAAVTVEDLMRRSAAIDLAGVLEAARSTAGRLGIEVREVVLKDVVVPSEIRSAAVELVTTRARGLARLEAARAETASLRALANAGRLLDRHPSLAQLRMIEAAPPGSRIVLSVGPATTGEVSIAAEVDDPPA